MELIWIPLSIFAALMQAVRTAAQKTLNQSMSTMGTTYVRSLAGLPFILIILWAVLHFEGGGIPQFSRAFVGFTFAGALTQVLATALLIRMFTLKSFAVGTMLIKTDILMTAFIGTAFFSETLSITGWIALSVVFLGVLLMLAGKLSIDDLRGNTGSLKAAVFGPATRIALLCAFMFTLSYLFFREATLILKPGSFLWRGVWTVALTSAMQTLFLGLWLAVKQPGVFTQLWPNRRIISFIGLSSALGSVGWFTAFAVQNASYVRAVGQIEAVFTLAISWLYFNEKISRIELIGMAVMVVGVLMFRIRY
ncbi:MAG: drug/metabolite transporter (DMT)-like permease [Gammaproteobacteria bacterium]|jgi:drug/metabolite transporter (DMT)-like permease